MTDTRIEPRDMAPDQEALRSVEREYVTAHFMRSLLIRGHITSSWRPYCVRREPTGNGGPFESRPGEGNGVGTNGVRHWWGRSIEDYAGNGKGNGNMKLRMDYYVRRDQWLTTG